MKKYFTLLFFLLVMQSATFAQNTFTVERIVPHDFDLEDNMIIKNATPYIINSVSVYENDTKIADCQNLAPKDDNTVMKFSDNGLSRFLGVNLRLVIESGDAKQHGAQVDVQYKDKDDDLIIEIISTGGTSATNQPNKKDKTGGTGFRVCMDVLHGFLEKRDDVDDGNGHKISFPTMCDQLNFTFGANVIPGLYVGLGPSGAIGWGNGAKASYNVGADLKLRYTYTNINVRPYAEYNLYWLENTDTKKRGLEHSIGVGFCFATKVFLGAQYWLHPYEDVQTKKQGRKTVEEKVKKTEKYFCIHFGLMF